MKSAHNMSSWLLALLHALRRPSVRVHEWAFYPQHQSIYRSIGSIESREREEGKSGGAGKNARRPRSCSRGAPMSCSRGCVTRASAQPIHTRAYPALAAVLSHSHSFSCFSAVPSESLCPRRHCRRRRADAVDVVKVADSDWGPEACADWMRMRMDRGTTVALEPSLPLWPSDLVLLHLIRRRKGEEGGSRS